MPGDDRVVTGEARYRVGAPQRTSMRTRDGLRLDADVYRPDTTEVLPVLLMRQPYGRAIASTVTYAHPRWYAARGYVVVIQDVRGRGSSEGTFDPFRHETADGWDTLDWVASLPGTTGQVGMYGFSYQGVTQLLAAASGHPALAAICPGMAGVAIRTDMAWEGGAFCLVRNLTWAAQLTAETARRAGDADAYGALYRLGHEPDLTALLAPGAAPVRERLQGSHFADWLDTPEADPYWAERSPLTQGPPRVPALYIGGWFDGFLDGTLRGFLNHPEDVPHRLLVGPWAHLPWQPQVGDWDMGPEADPRGVDRLQLAWFDRFLKGMDGAAVDTASVRLFDLTAACWRNYPEWDTGSTERWYLDDPEGEGAGALVGEPGRGTPTLVHDPWRPVPDLGGHAGRSPGPRNRRVLDQRSDVLTFDLAPRAEAVTYAGPLAVSLAAMADTEGFDLHVTLALVTPEGGVYNLTQGVRRVAPGESSPYTVSARGLCATVPAGHGLRLSVAAAAFPAYDMNPGTGTRPGAVLAGEHRVTTVTLVAGPDSTVDLPRTPEVQS